MIDFPENKPSWLEKFGLYYLGLFKRIDRSHSVFNMSDVELSKRVTHITNKGMLFSSLIGIACVFPTVWADVHFSNRTLLIHYGSVAIITIIAVLIEFYVLFLIALKAVYEVSDLINMHGTKTELADKGVFSVTHILARTALEIPDPELRILGIDPFERISKKNLFILGLLYKAKIIVTNFLVKYVLKFSVGNTLLGVPVLYEALPVECFWNSMVIKRVVQEARLRLFGFALAHEIANSVVSDKLLEQLSPLARTGCLRAIGNAVVMAQNYHPNMMILLIRFQMVLQVSDENKYDDWAMFLDTLNNVSSKERYFLLDLFTVSAAFDGRLSKLEHDNLRAVYGNDYKLYYPRLYRLTACLKDGRLNESLSLCKLDFLAG